MQKISEIFPEINFSEYKILGDIFQEAYVQHRPAVEKEECYAIFNVSDGYDFLNEVLKHHKESHAE